MKTSRDTNNNNSSKTQSHFSSNSSRQNSVTTDGISSSSHNCHSQQTLWRNNIEQSCINSNTQLQKSSTQNNNIKSTSVSSSLNPFASVFHVDTNQLSSLIQSYLSKCNGNQLPQMDPMNPLFYLQFLNTNTMLMQQLSTHYDSIKHIQNPTLIDNQPTSNSNVDSSNETMTIGVQSSILQADSNVFVPKTRPMSQDEIVEHTRLVYQRALQRNQLQQNNDVMKHLYETLHTAKVAQESSSITSTNHLEVPSVPNVSNIASIGTFDVINTMIRSLPSSCILNQESNINEALSSISLLSADDTKLLSNTSSILDPGAPIFIPRQSRFKSDDDNDTSSSSSDSDVNDFQYIDQFLEEFYNTNNEHDNHIILRKCSSSETIPNKYLINHNLHGQGDVLDESIQHSLSTTIEKQDCQYSICDLLNRYRNPRSHLVLPEWSRLSLILPNVCSTRAHKYKIKRYFAYRRRLYEDENVTKDLDNTISIQG